jgi:5-(carboxyamino)imidazole ribonucleotide mutase
MGAGADTRGAYYDLGPAAGGTTVSEVRVAILMGSRNDWDVMKPAAEILEELGIGYEARVLSAHRTPGRLVSFVEEAEGRGIRAFVCGAGGAAHLAGVVAAHTRLPVLGVPIPSSDLNGMDALLATVQMPAGIPVATFAIGKAGAKNAALFAAACMALAEPAIGERIAKLREEQAAAIPTEPIAEG